MLQQLQLGRQGRHTIGQYLLLVLGSLVLLVVLLVVLAVGLGRVPAGPTHTGAYLYTSPTPTPTPTQVVQVWIQSRLLLLLLLLQWGGIGVL